uniref:Uncharacterized protein n=1 Tax=Thermosporothrix sp. COM3 TaxID=2490863 RepID=A0A455SN27_9CHLR|nr:hypothetical protein KTC_35590 [Thermosporothrix sp. COM3]
MSRKKETLQQLSEAEHKQVQDLLSQYHTLAQTIRTTEDAQGAESVLQPIIALTEAQQITLLKALGKEQHQDAADLLVALNAFAPNKDARKEARRSLLTLEGHKIQPQWQPPQARPAVVQVNVSNPPRFWKGFVTQSREQGEVQLLLFWEQGYDYTEVRSLSFLLEFWSEGIKEVSVETTGKRRAQDRITELKARLQDVPLVECTLAEGRRLLEEALSVHNWRKLPLPKEYRNNQPLIKKQILEATEAGRDSGATFVYPDMEPQETALHFIGAWSMGDYGLTYDLLSSTCTLLRDATRDEWIEQHRHWADEAKPARIELSFVQEREATQDAIWLPSTAKGASRRKDLEIGWSVELSPTPLSGTLPEMPMGTAVNRETGRHWFWSIFTLVHEKDGWRIQRITDEGARIQGLPVAEIQQQIKEQEEAVDQLARQQSDNIQAFMEELAMRLSKALFYYDALIALLPLDRHPLEAAVGRAMAQGNPERTMVYLDRLLQRFPENHEENLRRIAATEINYAFSPRAETMPERRQHFLDLAENALHEAIELHDSSLNHILLAELFMSEQRNEEAETELEKARGQSPSPQDEATIEASLGAIAMRRERVGDALSHFQRASELDANLPGIWFNIGFAHRLLGHFEKAEQMYQRALQQEPQDIRIYSELIAIHMNRSEKQEAKRIAAEGVRQNPASAHLHALYASVLHELGERKTAQEELERAEMLDPTLEIVQSVRQQFRASKKR